jgi:hypothetical protein
MCATATGTASSTPAPTPLDVAIPKLRQGSQRTAVRETRDDPPVTDTAEDVWAEFKTRLNDATGTLVHARIALTVHRNRIANNLRQVGANPATPIETSSGPIPGHTDGISLQTWEQTAIADALSDRGVAFRQLGHQWVVFVYSMWEDEMRGRLAAAQGLPHDDV